MRHHRNKTDFDFIEKPVEFNKNTEKTLLQYCLGATLYMPATRDFSQALMQNKLPGLTSMVMCFEDAIKEEDLLSAQENALAFLNKTTKALDSNRISLNDLPLIFFRVRSPEQFRMISSNLSREHYKVIAGFVFPKFGTENGAEYFAHLLELNDSTGQTIYGMPILEGREIAFKETRLRELEGTKIIVDSYKDLVLNVRVGATDLSSCFGVRRGINYSIYDILTVRECLGDILNLFGRDNDYVVSGPVWEYFLANKTMKFSKIDDDSFHNSLLKRTPIIDDAADGLLREVILDKANGFIGKTIIHPTHIAYVNALQAVIKEEYEDALQIISTAGGVIKSKKANKMNEIKPHTSWAEKVLMRAKAYGVVEDEASYFKLF
ncbi:MAG: HpcH/HpaI aldolase/citrate lyase family protein [Clostridiales bacterium]|nr:HpcH/HpaI aldolase/citrate lyase family protein [Clostridiales bacterium]